MSGAQYVERERHGGRQHASTLSDVFEDGTIGGPADRQLFDGSVAVALGAFGPLITFALSYGQSPAPIPAGTLLVAARHISRVVNDHWPGVQAAAMVGRWVGAGSVFAGAASRRTSSLAHARPLPPQPPNATNKPPADQDLPATRFQPSWLLTRPNASLVVISPGSTERVVRWSGGPRDDDIAAIEIPVEPAAGAPSRISQCGGGGGGGFQQERQW
ncbi:hypothetical protein P154DRAFT_517296 [Amniculicola lignicola CBS 123094]|uniref:Uncharacterized protein n=1 Tax=Amniculicola lignicola CBS 123094 TaxID=1392246 RepID=A0A6A5X0F5_9PLEO|nr:hypothetical protein P154DRAFT_517296 [Amniculicola lignicola CBS 123094]